MGLPVKKLICASNTNKVLFDFFESGTYDRNREFHVTTSPSMDILISSNLERLIYYIAGCDADRCAELMKELGGNGKYSITDSEKEGLKDFFGGYADEKETSEQIKKIYSESGYVIDTHTAVASYVCDQYKAKTGDNAPVVIASTASPYKFTRSVMNSIDPEYDKKTDFELIDDLAKLSNTAIPQAIEDIRTAPVLHKTECDINEMKNVIEGFLK